MVKIISDMGTVEIRMKGSVRQITTEAVTGFIAFVRSIPEAKRLDFLDKYFEVLDMYKDYLIADDDEADEKFAEIHEQIIELINGADD